MKLNEFISDKEREQLDEILPAVLGAVGRGAAMAGSAALRGLGSAASAVGRGVVAGTQAVGRGVASAAPKVGQALARGAQATARGVGNLAGQTVGGAMQGFGQATSGMGGSNADNQQAQQQAKAQQDYQNQLAAQIAELEKALAGVKQSAGMR